MKLLTKEILSKLPPLYYNEKKKPEEVKIIVKFFHCMSNWTWYATEYDPVEKLFFGFVRGDENDMGYFSLEELESVNIRGIGIERDMYFGEHTLAEAMAERI